MTTPVLEWYCPECGSTDITHDALVAFDPGTQEFTVVGLLDAKQCEECGCESPEFGTRKQMRRKRREH